MSLVILKKWSSEDHIAVNPASITTLEATTHHPPAVRLNGNHLIAGTIERVVHLLNGGGDSEPAPRKRRKRKSRKVPPPKK